MNAPLPVDPCNVMVFAVTAETVYIPLAAEFPNTFATLTVFPTWTEWVTVPVVMTIGLALVAAVTRHPCGYRR